MSFMAAAADVQQTTRPVKEGESIDLGERKAVLQKLDSLPFVESEYAQRFTFDSYENPKLKELRERYHLDGVTAAGMDEFSKQVLLNDWVHRQFKKFGHPSTDAKGALDILEAIDRGHTFFCAQYAQLLVSCAASLGWVDRPIALRRHQGVAKVGGSTEHSVTEIWSDQYRKWVMLDPTSNMHLQKRGVPLNAWEIRQEWFYNNGKELVFVIGKEQRKYTKADLPIFLERFAGFGDLAVYPDELDKYGFIGFVPNTDLMDRGMDYGKMFIAKDELCEGTRWHERIVPAHPDIDPYFPIGQAALSLFCRNRELHVQLKTLTPNFKRFEASVDKGEWKPCSEDFLWNLRPGPNAIEVRTVNQFGVVGPVSRAEVEVSR
jgi:hypothetical protein